MIAEIKVASNEHAEIGAWMKIMRMIVAIANHR